MSVVVVLVLLLFTFPVVLVGGEEPVQISLCSVTFTYAFTVIPPLTNDPANEFMNGRAIPREKFNHLWTHF